MLKKVVKSFVDLVYPPICLHCRNSLDGDLILCKSCQELLELIDLKLHCKKCFSLRAESQKNYCEFCASNHSNLTAMASTFDYKGVATTLIKAFKYGNKPYLADGLAAFMATQFISLNWPVPDIIIPVPQSMSHFLTRGYNQAELLALSLSDIFKRPLLNALKRKSDDYSQAGLNLFQRITLSGKTIHLKKNQNLQDKCILLIDDVLTTGTTLQKCAESLLEDYPNSIYALTLCHANHIKSSIKN